MPARLRRLRPVPPGSLADRIRTAAPAGQGATMREIQAVALALPEDVEAEVNRLREDGYMRTWGKRKHMRYFWAGALLLASLLTPRAAAAGPGPLAWLGGGYTHTIGGELGGEVWFPLKSKSSDGAPFLAVVGGFNLDGTAKIGGGFGCFTDDWFSIDVQAYGLAATTAGGRQGWGVNPGFGFAIKSALRIRAGFDWGQVSGQLRGPGVSVLVQVGPLGR
jgi:hypothetical protein